MEKLAQEVTISRAISGGFAVYEDGQLAAVVERSSDLFLHVAQLFSLPPKTVMNGGLDAHETVKVLRDLIKGVRESDRNGVPITIKMIKVTRELTGCDIRTAKEAFESARDD